MAKTQRRVVMDKLSSSAQSSYDMVFDLGVFHSLLRPCSLYIFVGVDVAMKIYCCFCIISCRFVGNGKDKYALHPP